MTATELKYSLVEVKEVIKKWLSLEDDTVVDVMMGTYVANLFKSDPLWTLFIGAPSNAKTELLRGFDGHPNIVFISNLTPASILSGKKDKRRSSLFDWTDKTVVFKDFGTILVQRYENQQEILGALREIYDGAYSKYFGERSPLHWKGHMGIMAAATPVWDKHYGVISQLGDRFLILRVKGHDDHKTGMHASRSVFHEDAMRADIKGAIHRFIDQFNPERLASIRLERNETIVEKIVSLSCFCAMARCPVSRDGRTQIVDYIPMPEGPGRLVKQFCQLGVALALTQGKTAIDEEAYRILCRMGKDLIPTIRMKLIYGLHQEGAYTDIWVKTKDLGSVTGIPTNTAKVVCEDLMMTGILNRQQGGTGETSPYQWQISRKAMDLMNQGEMMAGSSAMGEDENEIGIPF